MNLTPESVNAYTEALKNPSAYNLRFRPLHECFEDNDIATPKDILFQQYQKEVGTGLPKVIFYIIMDNEYSKSIEKCPNGDLGYKLKYKTH